MPYVRHIHGALWEARVTHPTGSYRMFFGVGPGRMVAVACGDVKKSERFPPRVYNWAEREVVAYLALLADRESSQGE